MRTGQELLAELRDDLRGVTPATWQDDQLLTYIGRAASRVGFTLRDARSHQLERIIKTTDSDFDVYGGTYSPATSLKAVSGSQTIVLPEDCVEVVALLPLAQTDRDSGIRFITADVSDTYFDMARRTGAPGLNWMVYQYTMIDSNTVHVAPAFTSAFDLELQYVAMPTRVDVNGVLAGVPEWTYDGLILYACYRALRSIKHPDYQNFYTLWTAEKKLITDDARNRATQTLQITAGAFDADDWGYSDYA